MDFRQDLITSLHDAEAAIQQCLDREHGETPEAMRLTSLLSELEEYQRLLWHRGWRMTADDLTLAITKLEVALITNDPRRRAVLLGDTIETLRETRLVLEA